jgi:Zn-dependent peptidase ImmA (M78 family)/transcriptional regulator with XRE-family HTH domain
MSTLHSILARNVRHYRKKLDISQKELAKRTGFTSHQTISQIEKGQRDIKAWELFKIAKALYVDVSKLTTSEIAKDDSLILWRKTPTSDRALHEAEFKERCQQYSFLERLCKLPQEDTLPVVSDDLSSMSFAQAKERGVEIRESLGLGAFPAIRLTRVLEDNHNVKIWYQNLGFGGSAASSKGDFGSAILINSFEKPWRRNYSCAHELFHLITWESISGHIIGNSEISEKVERLADVFASTLLLPEESLRGALSKYEKDGKIEKFELIEIARRFDVSTDALLWRMCNMNLISEANVQALVHDSEFKAVDRMAREVTPEENAPKIPERFVRLAFHALQEGMISRTKIAEYFGVSLMDLSEFFLEYELDDTKDYKATINTGGC